MNPTMDLPPRRPCAVAPLCRKPALSPPKVDVLASRPVPTLGLYWPDGTPFRVSIYTPSQWALIPEDDRPVAYLDDTRTYYLAFTAAQPAR